MKTALTGMSEFTTPATNVEMTHSEAKEEEKYVMQLCSTLHRIV